MSEQSDDIETRRDRLIKYLLDEVEPEEKFEIEKGKWVEKRIPKLLEIELKKKTKMAYKKK